MKLSRTGPSFPQPMRVTEAVWRWSRHDNPAPAPSAQATAALMGVTWLTTTTSPSVDRAPVPRVAKSSSQAAAMRTSTSVRLSPPEGR